jgi:hypothetical protein
MNPEMPNAMTPGNEFAGAQKILWHYYERVVNDLASDIIRHADEFEKSTARADEILEKHYCRLSRIGCSYAYLRSFASKDKPTGTQPLSKDEFRCFGCGGIIKQEESSCKLCGWTWR